MSSWNLYIHGTPKGHQIWGSDNHRDYISTFYNHDPKAVKGASLQIEICRGEAFYTYIQRDGVLDADGRPGAFFAMTVNFPGLYCGSVYKLYQLFDALFNQICVGSILKNTSDGRAYLVRDFEAAIIKGNQAVGTISQLFDQKAQEMLILLPLKSIQDTFNRDKRVVSLLEVDSPLFFEAFRGNPLIVSAAVEPSSVQLQHVSKDLKFALAQNNELTEANTQLDYNVKKMTAEVSNLTEQLQTVTATASRRYEDRISELQGNLEEITAERDGLKKKLKDVSTSIDQIDQPFRQLTRLMAGRFPEQDSRNDARDDDTVSKNKGHAQGVVRRIQWNTLLLGLITVLSIIILSLLILKSPVKIESVPIVPTTETIDSKRLSETESQSVADTSEVLSSEPTDRTSADSTFIEN